MAQSIQSGRLPITVEIFVDSESAKNLYAIHHSSKIFETTDGISTATHILQSNNVAYFDNMLREISAKGTPRIAFRIGYITNGNSQCQPLQTHILVDHKSIPQGVDSGHFIQLRTADPQFELRRSNRVKSHKGDVSTIVKNIAKENNLKAVVEQAKGGVSGDPTETVGLIQSYESDASFIRNRLLPRAVSLNGIGNYKFFFRDGVLHFHTVDFSTSSKNITLFSQDGISDVLQMDNTQMMILDGSAGTRALIYSPLDGRLSEFKSNPESVLNFAKFKQDLEANPELTVPLFYHTNESWQKTDMENMTQSMFSKAYAGMFKLRMRLPNAPDTRAGDILDINITTNEARTSTWSGKYFVTDVKHVIAGGAIMSEFTLERGEFTSNLDRLGKPADGKILQLNSGVLDSPNDSLLNFGRDQILVKPVDDPDSPSQHLPFNDSFNQINLQQNDFTL